MRGSPRCVYQMQRNNSRSAPYQTNSPGHFLVTISNNAVKEQPAEAAHTERPVFDELMPHDLAGGDCATQPKPDFVSKKPAAPAQLFSSLSQARRSIRDDLLELLDVHPQGIELSNFCRVFEACFHHPIDSRWTDVSSLRQMLESMADVVECVEVGSEVIVKQKFDCDYLQGNALQL